jgi:uncharacterized membrane protein
LARQAEEAAMFRYGPRGLSHVHVVDWLILLVLVGLLVAAILAVIRLSSLATSSRGQSRPPGPFSVDPALGELRVRYARGEITWEECATRAANLGYPPVASSGPCGPSGPPPGARPGPAA